MHPFRKTLHACYRGYVTQAIIVNLAPLFFVFFREEYGLTFSEIAGLTAVNFFSQILVDLFATLFVDKLGYRPSLLAAHAVSFAGLVSLGLLPQFFPPYPALIAATVLYAVGSGLIEVIVSPVVDNVPAEAKSGGAMILLHAFYSWGQMLVVLLTTLVIRFFGYGHWYWIPIVWAGVPLLNFFSFLRVPIREPENKTDFGEMKRLFSHKVFYLAILMMIAAGSSEMVISQWASMFAEAGLGVDKTLGDVLGPCLFAFFMAIGRTWFGMRGERIDMRKCLLLLSLGTFVCYLTAVFVPVPFLSLAAVALTGFTVSAMWPGMLDLSSARLAGGTAMFGILAVAGDVGCSAGPALAGRISDLALSSGLAERFGMSADQFGLKAGILCAAVFPAVMFFGMLLFPKTARDKAQS
ncbi:MAG: MFS transporter [Clostridia bacterium]|nr:MFS transporter [Clostridia bacterium]